MGILAVFSKQPVDDLDYDVVYTNWVPSGDSILSAVVAVTPSGLTVASPIVSSNVVKLWVSGGTSGVRYKVEVTATTTLGRVKQDELRFAVRDI